MRNRWAGWVLMAVQLVLVLSVAAKYVYERRTRPRVWVRTGQFDPEQPLRGRYLALNLMVDACGLPRNKEFYEPWAGNKGRYRWEVRTEARDGKLVAVLEPRQGAEAPADSLGLTEGQPCDRASMQRQVEYFIPEHAKGPFPLAKGEELWAEVTVPEQGPPRPIQLAISGPGEWRILRFE